VYHHGVRRGFKTIEVVDTSRGLYVSIFCPSFSIRYCKFGVYLGVSLQIGSVWFRYCS
jgi:hypothetical protein